MMARQPCSQSRREFLKTLTLAGAAGVLGVHSRQVAAVEEKHQTHRVTSPQPRMFANNWTSTHATPAQTVVTTGMGRSEVGNYHPFQPMPAVTP